MEYEERHFTAIREKNGELRKYENHEKIDFVIDEDILGFDANVLVDLASSEDFRNEIKAEVKFNVLKIYTTNTALGEARNVLIKKKGFDFGTATNRLKEILQEFSIESIEHNNECNIVAYGWVEILKKKMYIKKFPTFPNDCRILANLIKQKGINVFFTEERQIEKAAKKLDLKVRVRIIPEAGNLDGSKIKSFFKESYRVHRKKHKPF